MSSSSESSSTHSSDGLATHSDSTSGSPSQEESITSDRGATSPTPPSSPDEKGQSPHTVGLYAVQCADCLKWRLIPNEEEYENIRCNLIEKPFVCSNKPNVTCDDVADIDKDSSRTWVLDKPNIPRAPRGFKRKLVLRRDFSKLDAHYVTPTGKKIRSSLEASRYLEENPDIKGVSVSDFSFTVPKVVEESIPKEIQEAKASAKGEKKGKDSK